METAKSVARLLEFCRCEETKALVVLLSLEAASLQLPHTPTVLPDHDGWP